MEFEWYRLKAERNLKDHGVSFEEAATAFDDPMQTTLRDDAHSEGGTTVYAARDVGE